MTTPWRDVRVIRWCKVCKISFRPERGSVEDRLGYCHTHRHEHYAKWWEEYGKKYFDTLSPEKQEEYAKTRYEVWLRWVEENKEKRRQIALASYHRNKKKRRAKRNKQRRERYKKTGK